MANVFMVEWTDDKGRRVRDRVEFGNFDGDVEEAQRVIDNGWPHNYAGRRSDWKVMSVVGAGEVVKVNVPRDNVSNASTARNPVVNEAPPAKK
jgi:hypothetical protein